MSADPRTQRMLHRSGMGLLAALITAAVSLVVFAIVMLFSLDLAGEFFTTLVPITQGIGGATASDIQTGTGNGFALMAVSVLSIPAAILMAALLGGRVSAARREPPRPPGGSGPF